MYAATYWGLDPHIAQQVALALIGLAGVQVIAGLAFDFAVERTGVPRFAAEMVVVACYILIVFNLFYSLGVNVTGIFATSAVATAEIGLSLQDMLSNIASGIALEFESDIRVGDFIKCERIQAGWVEHVRLRHYRDRDAGQRHRIMPAQQLPDALPSVAQWFAAPVRAASSFRSACPTHEIRRN